MPRVVFALQWYSLLGAPLAWATQLVVGYFLTEAACGPAGSRWGIALHTWEGVLFAVTGIAALGAWASAAALHRAIARRELPNPHDRAKFLSTVGIAVGAIFVAMILYTGTGVLTLEECAR